MFGDKLRQNNKYGEMIDVVTNEQNIKKKSRIRETLNLSTDADSSTDTILEKWRDTILEKWCDIFFVFFF